MDKDVTPVSILNCHECCRPNQGLNTPNVETFIENVSIDQFGDTRGKLFLNNNEHDIQLNRQSRGRRNVTHKSFQNIKQRLLKIRKIL